MNVFTLAVLLAPMVPEMVPHWTQQTSNTVAGLRGLSVVSKDVVWTSGTHGTVLRTIDGGRNWEIRKVPGAEGLDFRDVEGFDSNTALLMSSGGGAESRVYSTGDGGMHWTLVLSNPDAAGFFDAMKFWDRKRGILLGDAVAGHFTIFTTSDSGHSWARGNQPDAKPGEGAFAASGTCLRTLGRNDVWFGTGGAGVARVMHSADRGNSWSAADSLLSGSTASSGVFSVLFLDNKRGVAAGGDYKTPEETLRTLATTLNGGVTWNMSPAGTGFRSGLAYVNGQKMIISVGTGGSDCSIDGGATWKNISKDVLNAVDSSGDAVWAVGPQGLILKMVWH